VNTCPVKNNNQTADNNLNKEFTIFSNSVRDSFVISVQLPENYHNDSITKYPVVFLLDANFHFPMLAATVRQYEKGELLPPLILVGIGYKSFELMDSLRMRDYMYPAALPSDEISASGGGKKFDEFITDQLIPYIDSNYRTDKTNRSC
jgi:predicted alpha/beta superfamily hydrolase